jgi:tRNA pseudouridine55 synthase
MHGVLVIDKPAGRSSASTVDKVKKTLKLERAGHGGTLDPLATGVLAVCVNAGTKLAGYLLADDKAYEATGVLGIETDTLDRTGLTTSERAVDVDEARLLEVLARRVGEYDQIPPMYSAIKQDGVRLYRRARAGEDVERAARRIRIDSLELLSLDGPRFTIAVACSKGTYIRSLLADLGNDLGCGAHLAELRRTRSGKFSIDQAITLEQVATVDLAAHLIPCGRLIDLPRVVANPFQLQPIRDGLQLPIEDLGGNLEPFQILDEAGQLVAIAHGEGRRAVYDRVFPADATS